MCNVPKRRQPYVAKPIMDAMNLVYEDILSITEDPVKGSKNAASVRYSAIIQAQQHILSVEKPLYVYWNICGDPAEEHMKYISDQKRATLIDQFNDVVKLLHGMQVKSSLYNSAQDEGARYLLYYSEKEIQNAQFLSVLRELHRFTHSKITHISHRFRDAEADLIRKLIDDAWYHAVKGNFIPTDQKEYKQRRSHFSMAISALYKMERPMFSLFSLESYSNNEMLEWANLLNEAGRLLNAVQKSDKERFKNL